MSAPATPDAYRLPPDVKPTHYTLVIKTDLKKLHYTGIVKISLDVKNDTSTLVLNVSHLELGNASISSHSNTLKIDDILSNPSFDHAQERVIYALPHALTAGSKAELKITFSGELTAAMQGYYRSSWVDQGTTRHYALTHFEPTAARRAFPCWDEPALKATCSLTLISRADTANLGNMPVTSELVYDPSKVKIPSDIASLFSTPIATDDPWKITQFQTSPLMSTYFVAFANGHFSFVEKSVQLPMSKKTVPLRIYTTPDIIHQAQFALEVQAKSLCIYERMFNVEYPLPKLDTLVANDFDASAMENWGLIMGRTSAMLIDPNKGSLKAKKVIASIQCHEVAHMWFGNITTMEWWTYLYLNEGFATLMGEVIVQVRIFPEWKVDSEFVSKHLDQALKLDAKLSSHPIEVDCPDANNINEIFDDLSYSKAASVLRMLAKYIGEDRFLRGVSLYLQNNLYTNTVTTDLWKGISSVTGINVSDFMEGWITQMGFPMLTVTEDSENIYVRQDRFLETGKPNEKDNHTWTVPLNFQSINDTGNSVIDKIAVLSVREKAFPFDTTKPFKLNSGASGFYRVMYTSERLTKISLEAVKRDSIFQLNDRIELINDTMAFCNAGFMRLSSALALINVFRAEKEGLVWASISEHLNNLVSIWWQHPQIIDQLNKFRRALFSPLVTEFGFEYSESESAELTELRTTAITQAAFARDQFVIDELRSRAARYMRTGDDSGIPVNLFRLVLVMATTYGGTTEHEFAMKVYQTSKNPSQRIAAIYAMAATEDPILMQDTLRFVLNNAKDQDTLYFFRGMINNFKAKHLLLKFFKEEYQFLYNKFEGSFAFPYIVMVSLAALSTKTEVEDIEYFFKDKDTSKYRQTLSQTLESVDHRIAFIARSTDDLVEWMSSWEEDAVKQYA